jgi:hypothetical protein
MRSRVELTSCWRLFHPVRFEEDIGLGLLWRSLSKSAKPWLDNIPETLNISAHTDRQKTEMRWWCIIELRRWYIDYEKKEIWVSDLDSRDDWSWEGFWWMVQVSDTLPVTPTDTDCDAINNEWMNQARNETQQNTNTAYLSMISELGLIWGEAALTGEEKFGLYNPPPDMMIDWLLDATRSSSQKESASLTAAS